MIRSRSWISLVLLVVLGTFAMLVGISSVASANARYSVNKPDTSSGTVPIHYMSVTPNMKDHQQGSQKDSQLYMLLLQVHQSLRNPHPSPSPKKKASAIGANHHPTVHVVRPGDTLWKIAMDNHTSVSFLMNVNHLSSSVIHPGQKLTVYSTTQKLVFSESRKTVLHTVKLNVARKNGIPVNLIPVYQAAGAKYGIPWTVLAAIHKEETGFSTGPAVSSAGAQGPMQFMPATFEHYAVRAPECQGAPDINNVYDAIYTAAHMLAADGYAKNPSGALYQYNHSMAYVLAVESLAQTYQV